MESISNQFPRIPRLLLIFYTLWLYCISSWYCDVWIFKEIGLEFTAQLMIMNPHYLTAHCLLAPYVTSYCPDNTPKSGISLSLWCLVSSSDHAGLSFEPLQRAGGAHSLWYHNHWVLCPIVMFLKLCFAPVRQSMQMPAADHSTPRNSV